MLALTFRGGEFAFVYHEGRPIGVVRLPDESPRTAVLFGGSKNGFEVLRPRLVAQRYGQQELERLCHVYALKRRPPTQRANR